MVQIPKVIAVAAVENHDEKELPVPADEADSETLPMPQIDSAAAERSDSHSVDSPEVDLDTTVAYDNMDALEESISPSDPIPTESGSTRSRRPKERPSWMKSGDYVFPTSKRR